MKTYVFDGFGCHRKPELTGSLQGIPPFAQSVCAFARRRVRATTSFGNLGMKGFLTLPLACSGDPGFAQGDVCLIFLCLLKHIQVICILVDLPPHDCFAFGVFLFTCVTYLLVGFVFQVFVGKSQPVTLLSFRLLRVMIRLNFLGCKTV